MPPDLNELMQKAQEMMSAAMQKQQELAGQEVEAQAGGGMVVARANGRRELIALQIAPEIINPEDPEMLQDLILAAVNEALGKADALMKAEMQKMTGGLGIPGLG